LTESSRYGVEFRYLIYLKGILPVARYRNKDCLYRRRFRAFFISLPQHRLPALRPEAEICLIIIKLMSQQDKTGTRNMRINKRIVLGFVLILIAAPLWAQTYGQATTEQLHSSANKGDVYAQEMLGVRYYNGDRAPKDYQQAVYWFTKAAKQGESEAQFNLALCYYNGFGVAKDYNQAVYWWTEASNKGNAGAMYCLGRCYDFGEGVSKDEAWAAYYYDKAAKLGNADAQLNLGRCYIEDKGVVRNYSRAKYWLKKAQEQKHLLSDVQIAVLERLLEIVE